MIKKQILGTTSPSTHALSLARILGDISTSYCLINLTNKELRILYCMFFLFVYFLT